MSTTHDEAADQLREAYEMAEADKRRRYELRTINQTTGQMSAPVVFGGDDLHEQTSDPDTDSWLTIDQILALEVGQSIRFAGGAAPLFELRRIADCVTDYRVSLRKYRSTWSWFTTNPQGGGFGSSHQGSKRVAQNAAFRGIPAGASVEVVTEHEGHQIKREVVRA